MKSVSTFAVCVPFLVFSELHAATTVFTSELAFFSAISSPYTETFDSLSLTPGSPINFSSGGYVYNATSSGFYNAGASSPGDVWLSLDSADDSIVFNFTSGNVFAVGGYFFATNQGGAAEFGDVVIETNDGTSHTSLSSTPSTFVGFVSDVAITGLNVSVNQPVGFFQWPTVNDLTVAGSSISPIPEPTNLIVTAVVLAGGLSMRPRRKVNRKLG